MKDQPNPDIPVYIGQEEGSRKKPRVPSRNLLLPYMGLTCLDQSQSSDQPSVSEDQLLLEPSTVVADTEPGGPLVLSLEEDSELCSGVYTQSIRL